MKDLTLSEILSFLPAIWNRRRALKPCRLAAIALLTVLSSLEAKTIWSTPVGDFLVGRRASRANGPAAPESVWAPVTPGLFSAAAETSRRGYLAAGPARSLDWRQAGHFGTTFDRFPEPAVDPETNRWAAESVLTEPEGSAGPAVSAEPEIGASIPGLADDLAGPPAESGIGPAPEMPSGGIDERFVHWVTRRTGNTKVEIPFELPAGARPDNLSKPAETLRVRYREQP